MTIPTRNLLTAIALGVLGLGCSGDDAPPVEGDGPRPDARPIDAPDDPPPIDAPDDPPPTNIIYLSKLGNDLRNGKTPSNAVLTLGVALTKAAECTPICMIRVAEGTYNEAVTLKNDIDIEGGWDDEFTARNVAGRRVVVTSNSVVTVDTPAAGAAAITALTTLNGITIRGADFTTVGLGTPSIALRVRDTSTLVLKDVRVEAGKGGNGRVGTNGSLRVCSALGGAGGEQLQCGTGGNGSPGTADSDPSSGGAGGSAGNSNNCNPAVCPLLGSDGISDGGAGGAGGTGANGANGIRSPDNDGLFVNGVWSPSVASDGADGKHGTGGGGGGGGGSKAFAACVSCPSTLFGGRGGDGANGGCGGGRGTAGGGGGATFGVVLIHSNLQVGTGVTIVAAPGGAGGAGGSGVPGSSGGTDGSMGREPGGHVQCSGLFQYDSGAGGFGGAGGSGGHGGGGPGGNGGPSAAIVQMNNSAVTGSPSLVMAGGGAGGMGGVGPTGSRAEAGLDGASAPILNY